MSRRLVALTFDDGPSEWTAPILDVMKEHGARATFFVIGEAIEGRESVLRRTAAEGHEIGNHTWSHPALTTIPLDRVREELDFAGDTIERVLGARPRLFRPPYFDHSDEVDRVAAEAGYGPPVLCTIDPSDWATESPEAIVETVLAQIRAGSIVDLHDGRPRGESGSTESRQPTVDAVRKIVPALVAEGYRLVTVPELLAA